jgi:hypothetical protein
MSTEIIKNNKIKKINQLLNEDKPRSHRINHRLTWMFEILGISSLEELSDSTLDRLLQDFRIK